jgi:hypothetical protein
MGEFVWSINNIKGVKNTPNRLKPCKGKMVKNGQILLMVYQ